MRGRGAQKSYFSEGESWREKKDRQNSLKTPHLSKKFTSKLTSAKENF